MQQKMVEVWDPLVRIFHWSLVLSFFTAYFTEDDWMSLHVWAGYAVAGLVSFRVLWGFVGPRHARFSDFVRPPREALAYLKDELAGRACRYLGHNPAGGVMVVALLLSLAMTVFSGFVVYGAGECSGPLASIFCGSGKWLAEVGEEVHEFLANFTLFLVVLHVAGVMLASVLHHENLVRAMFDGRKRSDHQ